VLRVAELTATTNTSTIDSTSTSSTTTTAIDDNVNNPLLNPCFHVNVAIPTGAMGNIVACTMAKRCGLPIGAACAGTNANDVTFRVLSKGDFSIQPAMHKTLSDAINIMCP
jgi:hypothetical protein